MAAAKKNTRKRKPTLRVAVRPSEPAFYRRPVPLTLTLGALALLALIIYTVITSGALDRGRRSFYDFTLAMGLKVDEIYVTGRKEVLPEEITNALNVRRGDPILAIDMEEAHHQLLNIPWVARARIERHLPNIVYVDITERMPFARWQYNHQTMVIDQTGIILSDDPVTAGRFSSLPLVVGENANLRAAEILGEIANSPFAGQLKAAVRVSDRRWDLQLAARDGGTITVKLPELAPLVALQKLGQLWRASDLGAKPIRVVDARLPDRITLDDSQAGNGNLDEPGEQGEGQTMKPDASKTNAKPAAKKAAAKAASHSEPAGITE